MKLNVFVKLPCDPNPIIDLYTPGKPCVPGRAGPGLIMPMHPQIDIAEFHPNQLTRCMLNNPVIAIMVIIQLPKEKLSCLVRRFGGEGSRRYNLTRSTATRSKLIKYTPGTRPSRGEEAANQIKTFEIDRLYYIWIYY